jgi:hypothetical protein
LQLLQHPIIVSVVVMLVDRQVTERQQLTKMVVLLNGSIASTYRDGDHNVDMIIHTNQPMAMVLLTLPIG